jgi:hypothetical protein
MLMLCIIIILWICKRFSWYKSLYLIYKNDHAREKCLKMHFSFKIILFPVVHLLWCKVLGRYKSHARFLFAKHQRTMSQSFFTNKDASKVIFYVNDQNRWAFFLFYYFVTLSLATSFHFFCSQLFPKFKGYIYRLSRILLKLLHALYLFTSCLDLPLILY